MSVTTEQIRTARKTDLFEYLLRVHPDAVKKEGHWLRFKTRPGICTKEGLGGYRDYASSETGNSIDFLVRYMNYDFMTAVNCLVQSNAYAHSREPPGHGVSFPQEAPDTRVIFTYLGGRGFSNEILNRLITENLLYQDIRGNAVFRSAGGDFFELRGTRPGKPFHQCGKESPDCFWAFSPDAHPVRALICECAIDAVSLYLLLLRTKKDSAEACAYCGIAGVANQKAIERIQGWLPTVLAVDNDAAGQDCRRRNSHLPSLIPRHKDWNEDLCATIHS